MRLNDHARTALVTKLDPDGHIRDLIDVAIERYHQRRSADDGASPPSEERPDSDGCTTAGS